MIQRIIEKEIAQKLNDNKIIVLLGSRQVGKTTLAKQLLQQQQKVLFLTGDDADTIAIFNNATLQNFTQYFAGYNYLIIDEAQRIANIGIKLKLITDNIDNLKVIVTGSSAFELANTINEPLTGRKWEYKMFPISFAEMANNVGLLQEKNNIHTRLLYGYYPEVVNNIGNEKEILKQLTDSFLYKDILNWQGIKNPQKLMVLLKALALQVGNMVSYNELSTTVGIDKKTVEKYIDLLEKVFVIFRITSYSRNLRNELTKSQKIYFYDNGIRNAIIAAFQPIDNRQDIGAIWENFIVAERQKYIAYNNLWANTYFWRTQAQQEIDLIEETDGMLNCFEIKWNPNTKVVLNKTFSNAYPQHTFNVINNQNFWQYLIPNNN